MYDVNEQGVIVNPGKFEGEMEYIPYFWDFCMNGFDEVFWNKNDVMISVFPILEDDVKEYPELKDCLGMFLYLWEDNSGFVHSELSTEDYRD